VGRAGRAPSSAWGGSGVPPRVAPAGGLSGHATPWHSLFASHWWTGLCVRAWQRIATPGGRPHHRSKARNRQTDHPSPRGVRDSRWGDDDQTRACTAALPQNGGRPNRLVLGYLSNIMPSSSFSHAIDFSVYIEAVRIRRDHTICGWITNLVVEPTKNRADPTSGVSVWPGAWPAAGSSLPCPVASAMHAPGNTSDTTSSGVSEQS